jgi:hypothetical protein
VSLHLHGVVRARHRLPDDSPFRLVGLEDLAVVVSDRGEERALTEQEAVAHLSALCALLPGGPVLPMRIGTTAVDGAAARAAVHALVLSTLRDHLSQLDGMAEMHVRLVFEEGAALRAVHDKGTLTGGGGDLASTIAQGERIAREIEWWRRNQADVLLAPIAEMARAVALLDSSDHTEEHRAFVVRLDEAETVRAAVSALGTSDNITSSCIGPLPAFHFFDLATQRGNQSTSRWGW